MFLFDACKALALTVAISLAVRCSRSPADRFIPCPAGWYINGISPAGVYRCRPVLGDPDRDIIDAVARLALEGDAETYGLLYCTGGATPRHDGSSVWCQR